MFTREGGDGECAFLLKCSHCISRRRATIHSDGRYASRSRQIWQQRRAREGNATTIRFYLLTPSEAAMNDMKREEIYSNVEVHDASISPFPGPQVRPERIYRCHAKAIMEYDGLYDYATLLQGKIKPE